MLHKATRLKSMLAQVALGGAIESYLSPCVQSD
jgi:hypothetical protein